MAEDKDIKQPYLGFDEYIRQGEPDQKEKAEAWRVAIGLQAVDGLTTSEYLQDTARRNIEGDITIDEARELVKQYYVKKTAHANDDSDKEEADCVSANIVKVLSSPTFDFTTRGYQSVHRRVFEGVMKHAGEFRTYDISKKEWVLEGDSVRYLNWEDLRRAIEYELEQERAYTYKGKSQDELISHLTRFVSGLWQIHAFGEGDTRATAVFTIQYLRSLGFDVDNDPFALNSWYFRNALVRANYRNVTKGVDYSPIYLERFFRNLLLGEQWDLRNRYLHIHPTPEWSVQPNLATTTSTPDKLPDKFSTNNLYIKRLVKVIGHDEMTIKDTLKALGLKDRESFMNVYLTPAMKEQFVSMKYPHSPRHPRQRYLLTLKGQMLYQQLAK